MMRRPRRSTLFPSTPLFRSAPTLILCAGRDRLTPPALSEHLRTLIPRSRLSLVEGAGHMLLLEAPERVNQEILGFAASLRGEARSFTVEWERRGRSLVRGFWTGREPVCFS